MPPISRPHCLKRLQSSTLLSSRVGALGLAWENETLTSLMRWDKTRKETVFFLFFLLMRVHTSCKPPSKKYTEEFSNFWVLVDVTSLGKLHNPPRQRMHPVMLDSCRTILLGSDAVPELSKRNHLMQLCWLATRLLKWPVRCGQLKTRQDRTNHDRDIIKTRECWDQDQSRTLRH